MNEFIIIGLMLSSLAVIVLCLHVILKARDG